MNDDIARITALVPHLRRFAMALTGSRDVGDDYALAALKATLAKPACKSAVDSRRQLYRELITEWEPRMHDSGDGDLASVPPLSRAALLLREIEAFDIDQVSAILRRPVSEVQRITDQAVCQLNAAVQPEPM
jgi:DNA-directed RNA polymerase specialized sigma24 family protein